MSRSGMSNRDVQGRREEDLEQEFEIHLEKCNPFLTLNPIINGDCKCGGKYILRQNHRNKEYFYGCTNYPNCKIIHEIWLESNYLFEKESDVRLNSDKKLDGDKRHQEYLKEKIKRGMKNEIRRKQAKMGSTTTSEDLEAYEESHKDISLDIDEPPMP